MKKQIVKKLSLFVLAVLLVLVVVNGIYRGVEVEGNIQESSLSTIEQIEDILSRNEQSIETLADSLKDEYKIKAQTAAYIVEHVDINTTEEFLELAELINVDEIHIFDEEGVIYKGSEEKYFGYSFDSGEQMAFFLPLLTDKTLTLCQDVTPNTAEDKLMMYVATWMSDGSNIVQIGLEPERIIEAQSQNELSYIFANMPTSEDTILFAIDPIEGTVIGTSEEQYLGKEMELLGVDMSTIDTSGELETMEIDGIKYVCVFQEIDDVIIGVTVEYSTIFYDVVNYTLLLNFYCILVGVGILFALLQIIEVTILRNFEQLIVKVDQIANGNLDTKVDIKTSPEFSNLSEQLNVMVTNLLDTTDKISRVLDHVDTKMAIYEYKKDMKRVFATSKMGELLQVNKEELNLLLSDKDLFEKKIQSIKKNNVDEDTIYYCDNGTFLSIETLSHNEGEYGLMIDVTDSVNEKNNLQYERDYDMMTELLNRRAFYREIEKLFGKDDQAKNVMIIALDMDNLKMINDVYGHDAGDTAIKHCAYIMKMIKAPNKIMCRLGGDEFVVVIYGEEREILGQYIEELAGYFQNAYVQRNGVAIDVKMSGGYVMAEDYEVDYSELLKYADQALYMAKRSGRSRFIHYEK
ncbi:MAG: diguanylate cyclase [Eubacteriales bacterium]